MQKRNWKVSIRIALFILWTGVRNLWRVVWNKNIKLQWRRAFIRADEFHCSQNPDMRAMSVMSREEQRKYWTDIGRRRQIAHDQDMARMEERLKVALEHGTSEAKV